MEDPSIKQQNNKQDFQVKSPAISVPKGGGAIRGIGEKFAANPVTGTGSMSFPIATSPGRSGFGPQLSLSYDSGAGNGPFGFGWNLSIPSITRKTDKGLPQYRDAEESDVFILSGAEDLVREYRQDDAGDWVRNEQGNLVEYEDERDGYIIRRYRPRTEGLFARIERWTDKASGVIHWRSISSDNITSHYGRTTNSRITDPYDARRVFSWLICESYDDKGNAILYEYTRENDAKVDHSQANERNRIRTTNRYLQSIKYGNRVPNRNAVTWQAIEPIQLPPETWMFEVVFDYEEGRYTEETPDAQGQVFAQALINPPAGSSWPVRQDPFSSYRAGFEMRTYRLCRRVLMFHHFPQELGINDCLVRSTEFSFSNSPIASFITSITQSGYVRQPITGQPNRYLKKTLPPLEFEYSKADIQDDIRELDPLSLENLPVGLDGTVWRWVDLDGEAVSGFLTEQADAWFYKPNLGNGNLGPQHRVAAKPSLASLSNGGGQLLDLAGDGQLDLVTFASPTPGFYERTHDQDWEQFRTFSRLPNIRWDEPNLRFVDLTGDGHADVLITEQDAFSWHLSLAEAGFDQAERVQQALDEETGPRLVFADGTSSIYLADFSGDGLVDLARVRNGEVCYWPNLGYGRFGAKVTMDNAPWFENIDQFSQERVRLADVDGSGTNDIIYLGRDEVLLYFNQSGNRWSEPRHLDQFPDVDSLTSVMTVDLLGNGTACLVWSSPLPGDSGQHLRYITLIDEKPHLLVGVKNNLGAETRVHYAPSTNFYLKDKQDGKPWVTRLPFPVHVVERVETYDHISRNRFVTRYAYHHGYFDGFEREFRGFGMVEQWDTEEYSSLEADGMLDDAENLNEASHVPPVLTKTWFHTGIYLGRDRVSNFFAGLVDEHDQGEYFREPAWRDDDGEAMKHLLPDTVLPPNLTLEDEREACRALKGAMLRQETYALDGSDKADIPYLVTEQNFTVQRLQPRGENRHAVFLTHAREMISYHYERDSDDPRISHAMTLEVDDYGNVRKELAVGYGRRPGLSPLQGEDKEKQEQTLMTLTENEFTKAVDLPPDDQDYDPDSYRTPLPYETCAYELTGFSPENSASRFSFDELTRNDFARLELAEGIAYEETVNHTSEQKRLIEHVRTLYRRNELRTLLPLGEVESLALPGESYKLAFTPDLLGQVYERNRQPLLPDRTTVLGGQGSDQGGYVNSRTLKDDNLFPPDHNHLFWTGSDEDDHWWIPSGRVFYDDQVEVADPVSSASEELAEARRHFYLPRLAADPFDQPAVIRYDDHDLLITHTIDVLGNAVTATNDYRALQPWLVTGPNRNRTALAFDALGLVVATAVMGKEGEDLGDLLEDFDPDPPLAVLQTFAADPQAQAASLLGKVTTRFVYDLGRCRRAGQPPFAAALARETHFHDENGSPTNIQISFSYSDGFGREIQKKIQAEVGQAPLRQDPVGLGGGDIRPGDLVRDGEGRLVPPVHTPHRCVGTGRTEFNNKGKPVRQYEPFFSATYLFEPECEMTDTGVSPVLFYDPIGRLVATLHPNHTYEKVVLDPWRQETWDVNDTLHPTQKFDPHDPGELPPHTVNPADDPDVGGYFERLPVRENQPTWYDLRMDAAKAMEHWPDVDPVTGEPIPENATIRAVERSAAEKAARHAATPSVAHFDTLGRTFLTFADNGLAGDGAPQMYATRVKLDIEGNQREVRDAIKKAFDSGGGEIIEEMGRVVMLYDYDMLGSSIHQASMEAGERWILNDATGKPIRSWDNRGHMFKSAYDELRRSISQVVRGSDVTQSDPHTLNQDIQVEKTEYGEGQTNDVVLHLRTRVFKVYDNAGVVTNASYDFKGNLLQASRTLAEDYKKLYNWDADTVQPSWETFSSSTTYDALNRPLTATSPDDSVYRPTFNEANLLNEVDINLRGDKDSNGNLVWTPFVTNIDYDAKGQRTLIDYGNSVRTTYEYDKWTFRLARFRTIRGTKDTSDCTPVFDPRSCEDPPEICSRLPTNACILQDLSYSYDPAGNITHIQDSAQQIIYFRNMRVEPSTEYTYDAIYRLIEANGREHLGQIGGSPIPPSSSDAPRTGLLHPSDGNAMGRYLERYAYDEAGNFKEMNHTNSDPAHPGWTRSYASEEASLIEGRKKSNRLSSTTIGSGTPETYTYDSHGNMTRMNHLPLMQWDYRDRLQATSQQVVDNGGTPEITYYIYDATGQRVCKVTERQAPAGRTPARKAERIYLGGFEIYREYENDGDTVGLERETLHIMDDRQRIALVETKTVENRIRVNTPVLLQRYQLGNHLGSASLELDQGAQIISYEEYYPYGSTSYQSGRSAAEVRLKRYRYIGKERDRESGLSYHGARYYSTWLGRWLNCDPSGLGAGINFYSYGEECPTVFLDPSGFAPQEYEEQRSKDASVKKKEMKRNLEEAAEKGYKPDPMQERAVEVSKKRKKQKTPIEQHHHKGAKQAGEVKLDPKKMGDPMSSIWSTKQDLSVQAGMGDKPVWDPDFPKKGRKTPHNVARALDLDEQSKGPKTPKGLEDAASASKKRLPATFDLTERANPDWTRIDEAVTPWSKIRKSGSGSKVAKRALRVGGKVAKYAAPGVATSIALLTYMSTAKTEGHWAALTELGTETALDILGTAGMAITITLTPAELGGDEMTQQKMVRTLQQMYEGKLATPLELARLEDLPEANRKAEVEAYAMGFFGHTYFLNQATPVW